MPTWQQVFQIYPYWNVNTDERQATGSDSDFQIYPYWNVNLFDEYQGNKRKIFQIYPYWNVNSNYLAVDLKKEILSNLSILECKLRFSPYRRKTSDTFKSIHIGM